jgi:NADH:ubiquinone oxidoreductase subunit 6 (subunit J)
MSKDQALGGLIVVVCVVIFIGYVGGLFLYDPYIKGWLNIGAAENVHFWLIATPMVIAFIAILAIGSWIGYTMATTPSPKPIEEITTETKAETEIEDPKT